MMLGRCDFDEFFASVNDGHNPFVWQRRLLAYVLDNGSWPDVIGAPTGSGKSNVVDVFVFANALVAREAAPRLPRRMAVVVNRRALVDHHAERARRIADALRDAEDGILLDVAEALRALRSDSAETSVDPLIVNELRGALAPERGWIDDPTACAVICATPDMWASRLLMRGYGSSRRARPREAGFLGLDAVMILDEAHLNQQLLATARRVRKLQDDFEKPLGIPHLQVVETTATPRNDASGGRVSVTSEDLDDELLSARLIRPKPVKLVEAKSWPSGRKATKRHVTQLVNEVISLKERLGEGTVGCIVNRVDTAIRVADMLKKQFPDGVGCWVGRMRPMDVRELQQDNPELLDSSKPPRMDVLVATQTVEVGVDLDLAGLVTELASGDAIAQRVGRVNRRGNREEGLVTVILPSDEKVKDYPPYCGEDLVEARSWLRHMAEEPNGVSPWQLVAHQPPQAQRRRPIPMRLEWHDVERLSHTSEIPFAEEDLGLWIAEDLEENEPECGLVVRDLPEDEMTAFSLLHATPPHTDEVFPVSMPTLRAQVESVLSGESSTSRAFVWRNDSRQTEAHWTSVEAAEDLEPGDVVCVDKGHELTQQRVVVPPEHAVGEDFPTAWGVADDVKVYWGHDRIGGIQVADLDPEDLQTAQELLGARGEWDVTLSPLDDNGCISWVILTRSSRVLDDDVSRQTWSPADRVFLSQHSKAVADRAEAFGRRIGLSEEMCGILRLAGQWHDAGKADPRFQQILGNDGSLEPVAKSTGMSLQRTRQRAAASPLPRGWRHEHKSAAMAMAGGEANLVTRLVGTTHGEGRVLPMYDVSALCTTTDSDDLKQVSAALFEEGGWDELVESTQRDIGAWSICFLEGVLRAADCQVSKEGS